MIEKEFRALLPAWTACAVALLAASLGVYPLNYLGVPIYFITVAALGAFSMGHEYAFGTLGFSLTLPLPRWRIWATKLGVLVPMIAALALLAAWRVDVERGDRTFGAALFWLPALAAVFIAPWLTMITRSPLAAIVFTMSIVGGSMAFGEWIGVAHYGFTREVDAFRVAFMWWMVGGLSFVGAIAGWRAFARLEVAGDRGSDVQLLTARPGAAAIPALRRRRAFAALLSKELRLQQLSLVVAVIYVAGSLAVGVAGRTRPELYGVLTIFTTLYTIVLPIVIGSLAGAEEQQFGTHDAQLLLPVAASRQWFTKAGAAIGLSLGLALLVPYSFAAVLPLPSLGLLPRDAFEPRAVLKIVGLASVALYASTLARNGLSALIYSIGAIVGLTYFTFRIGLSVAIAAFDMVPDGWRGHPARLGPYFSSGAWVALAVAFALLVLRLALTNYRYADRSAARVARHALATMAAIAACAAVYGVVGAL